MTIITSLCPTDNPNCVSLVGKLLPHKLLGAPVVSTSHVLNITRVGPSVMCNIDCVNVIT